MKTDTLTFTVTETAKMLGISRNSAYEAVSRGDIPSIKIGKRLLIPCEALKRLLQDPTMLHTSQEKET